MERAVLVLSALLLNAILAGPPRWYEAMGLGRLSRLCAHIVRDAERRLNREHRSTSEREMRGILLVAFVIVAALLSGWILEWLFSSNLHFLELLLVAVLLPVRPAWDTVSQIRKLLAAGNVAKAREVLHGLLWRPHTMLDEFGIARTGIEILAVHFSEKILAPVLWYIVFGLPGFLLSKSVYLVREILSHTEGENHFAKGAKAAHAVLHFIPSRIAAVLWLASACFLPSAKLKEAAKKISPAINSASPHRMALLSAASVLNLGLGGPTSMYVPEEWVGSGTVKPMAADVKRALYAFVLMHLLLFVLFGLFL